MNPEKLSKQFDLKKVKGWVALNPKTSGELTGFRTSRLAKLVGGEEFQFSIGATKRGESHNLNNTIRKIIKSEDLEVLERHSTDGSRNPRKEYPAFRISDTNYEQFNRIINKVIGAIYQIRSDSGT